MMAIHIKRDDCINSKGFIQRRTFETKYIWQTAVSPKPNPVDKKLCLQLLARFSWNICGTKPPPIYASLSLSAVFPLERWKRPIVCQFASGGGELTLQRGGKHWVFSAVKKTRGYKLMFFSEVQLWIRWQDCLRSLRLTEKSAGSPDKDWQRLP